MLFPTNKLTKIKTPAIYFQNEGKMDKVSNINKFYTSYYNSQLQTFWQTDAYNLQVMISAHDQIKIIIPTMNTILPIAKSHCPCFRKIQESKRLFREMINAYEQLKISNER